MTNLQVENDLIAVCASLIGDTKNLTAAERQLLRSAASTKVSTASLKSITAQIEKGKDPLGDAFSIIRTAAMRRTMGAIYTPLPIVQSMLRWLSSQATPARIVDPGAGSGRFILAAGIAFPDAILIAVEMDPVAALMLRANACVLGMSDRIKVVLADYRDISLPKIKGSTAFIGNPPYVRHHDIGNDWKEWYTQSFASLNIRASALAGLHLHFFLKTRLLAKAGDVGAFITSAEWMDVNYGSALRHLLVDELGGLALHVLEPTVEAFPGTQTTAAITCFKVGESEAPLRVRAVSTLPKLNGLTAGTDIPRADLIGSHKWSNIIRPTKPAAGGEMELGELFRVHRGQVTGANNIWIAGEQAQRLPEQVLVPAVTKAKELIEAGERLRNPSVLRRIVDIPADLDMFTRGERQRIQTFLNWALEQGGDQSYIAQHRKAWWSVGLKAPAPILATYMARRAPQFTINECDARHINVAHGLYPREAIDPKVLGRIAAWLNKNINIAAGRTYAGGLTKFEPKEMERLHVPRLETFTV